MRQAERAATALADAFQSAPFEANGWDRALKLYASATRSSRANLVEVAPGQFVYNWITDTPSRFHEMFDEIGAGDPAINWRIASALSPLQVSHEHHYRAARRKMKSSIYTDYAEAVDSPFGCQTVLTQSPVSFQGIAMLRSRSDGVTTEADREVFAAAAPHLLTALRMQQAIHRQGAELAAGALESMNAIAFVCDAFGKVIAHTGSAEAFLRASHALRLKEGWLSAPDPDDDRRLQSALSCTLRHDGEPSAARGVWLRSGGSLPAAARCELYRMPTQEWALGWQPRALVTVHIPRSSDADRRRLLREMFHLTEAEAEIALLAGKDLSREAIAHRRGASAQTVKAQLKTIYSKTDVRREAELVALVNGVLR